VSTPLKQPRDRPEMPSALMHLIRAESVTPAAQEGVGRTSHRCEVSTSPAGAEVYPGGQAIVGNVAATRRGARHENVGQPHATDDK
jgi:hypothetical protein